MSRVARIPVSLIKGVEAQVAAGQIVVKGPLGTLKQALDQRVHVKVADGKVSFAAADASLEANAMSGTLRALVAGMVEGVTRGFERRLSLVGVGYRPRPRATRSRSRSATRIRSSARCPPA